jgi:hypothetical protein
MLLAIPAIKKKLSHLYAFLFEREIEKILEFNPFIEPQIFENCGFSEV